MQAAIEAHPWLLALPELQSFREFLVDTASKVESGDIERRLRAVRLQIRSASVAADNTSANPPAASATAFHSAVDGAEIEKILHERAMALLPNPISPAPASAGKRLSGSATAVGPCVLLCGATLAADAARDKEGVYVLMWMIDSLNRCVSSVRARASPCTTSAT